jgi:superoxide dismutase, Cu-Zn family
MEMSARTGRRIGAMVAVLVVSSAFAASVLAGGAVVTRGDVHAFATGIGQTISGHAQMVRTPDGRTFVTLHVDGLAPGTTYASHVHKQACANGEADGHYRFDPAGSATPPNEIWPGPFTTNGAGIGNANTIAEGTAGPAAVSVVVHAPGGAKIACADLH